MMRATIGALVAAAVILAGYITGSQPQRPARAALPEAHQDGSATSAVPTSVRALPTPFLGAPQSPTPPVSGALATPAAAPSFDPLALLPLVQPPSIPLWQGPPQMNLLLVGLDRRPDEQIGRTDSMILARVDFEQGTIGMLSVPRDLIVDIPEYGQDRVNAAYVYGELRQPGYGIENLKATIRNNFDVPIDHYAVVDFACFRGLVDAVGGVEVDVPKHIVDATYPTDDYGTKTVEFLPGLQHLDGARALEYARTRHADSDFGRMRRQQQIALAVREQVMSPGVVAAVPSIVQSCWGTTSDLSVPDLVSLSWTARGIDGKRVRVATIDETLVRSAVTARGASVLLADWPRVRARVAEVFPSVAASAAR